MKKLLSFCAALALAAPAAANHHGMDNDAGSQSNASALAAVLDAERRANDRARDSQRHPAETLAFFKVEPGMTVVDYMPSGGWYTRIIVPYLGKEGRYIGLNPAITPAMPEGLAKYLGNLSGKFAAMAAKSNLSGASAQAYNGGELGEEMNGTVDRVLIFREMHNLHRMGLLHNELNALHGLLKADGMLGIVQHRAKPWGGAIYSTGQRGYMRQRDVIGLVEAHGFELVATSEINANPKDTSDYPGGVWELPPVLRTKRDELKSVGESDRMTLLFRKRD